MRWQPANLTEVCLTSDLAICSSFGFVYLSLLVQLYGDSEDRRVQEKLGVEETRWSPPKHSDHVESETFDFIVVGAGAAGCVVANRLTEQADWSVLLLEAGPEQPDVTLVPGLSTALLGSTIDWSYRTTGNGKSCLAAENEQCVWPRGKVMGGSTTINSMTYMRGNIADYDRWASYGNEGWSYKDVLPFFKKSEKNLQIKMLPPGYHGADGEQEISAYPYIDRPSHMVIDAFKELGLSYTDFNGPQQIGTNIAQALQGYGRRVSTNNAFIQPIRYKRKNLRVKVNSEVERLLIDDKKHVYGVVYNNDGRVYKAYARKEVVLSAGPIGSPKILLLSGIGPKEHLEDVGIKVVKDLPVGDNLSDHVSFDGLIIAVPNATNTLVDEKTVLREVKNYNSDGPLSGNGPVNSIAVFPVYPNSPLPDIQVQINNIVSAEEFVQYPNIYSASTLFPSAFYNGIMPRLSLLQPRSIGFLKLNATNPYGQPIIYPNYLSDRWDVETLIRGIRIVLELENTKAFRSRGVRYIRTELPACRHLHWGTDKYFECLIRSYTSSPFHPIGSCKMGRRKDAGVVDSRLRVYGISGLRVIDSSIFPDDTHANTCAPAIMVGERGVDFLIRDWLKGY